MISRQCSRDSNNHHMVNSDKSDSGAAASINKLNRSRCELHQVNISSEELWEVIGPNTIYTDRRTERFSHQEKG